MVQDNERVSLLEFRTTCWWDEVENFWDCASISPASDTDESIPANEGSRNFNDSDNNNGPRVPLFGSGADNVGRYRHPDGPAIHLHWGSVVDCVGDLLRERRPISQLMVDRPFLHCANYGEDGTENPWVMWKAMHFCKNNFKEGCDTANAFHAEDDKIMVIPQSIVSLAGIEIGDRWQQVRAQMNVGYESLALPQPPISQQVWRLLASGVPGLGRLGWGAGSA
jgi:hypothetical protein